MLDKPQDAREASRGFVSNSWAFLI